MNTMGHRILVMSPLHNLGSTFASAFIAHAMTFDNKTSTTVFTQVNSHMPAYLGIESVSDPTRSIMQIVRLIDNGALDDKNILDYAHNYSKNGWLLNLADQSLEGRDRDQVVRHIYSRVPTDVCICDNSDDLDTQLTKGLLEVSDMLFIVVDMSGKASERLSQWMATPILRDFKNVYVLVNKYSEVVSSLREYAKRVHVPANRVCKIHLNPWIQKCTLNGKLNTLIPSVRDLDPRVANLNADINELIQCINGDMLVKNKEGT